ncbi:MAG: crossover junction endodeoxyribonuclease RuvC [Actinobacteria bacterium]|nr:crossover junction endodeoxyribonuclease RuvC [Actinomycetota bacterium]
MDVLAMGVITSPSEMDVAHRLATLHQDFDALLSEVEPSAVAVERVFFQSNVSTAMSVAQASGVVLALASMRGIPVVQYSPSQVKSAVAGSGTADKLSVQKMVQRRLGLQSLPEPADAADAAAIALCHLAASPLASRVAAAQGARS